MGDLPEEDQEENELPTLPRNKDPSGQTITNPLLSKRPPNSKQMVSINTDGYLQMVQCKHIL